MVTHVVRQYALTRYKQNVSRWENGYIPIHVIFYAFQPHIQMARHLLTKDADFLLHHHCRISTKQLPCNLLCGFRLVRIPSTAHSVTRTIYNTICWGQSFCNCSAWPNILFIWLENLWDHRTISICPLVHLTD